MTPEEIEKLVNDFANKLGEHCNGVRIFVTFPNTGSTTCSFNTGRGDYYSMAGYIREWQIMQDEFTKLEARKERKEPDEENP